MQQQTATADVLNVISRSAFDVQPVFETIIKNAAQLCQSVLSAIYRSDGELVHLVAHDQFSPESVAAVRAAYPRTAHRYYAMKARWLGKKSLAYWDRNAPLPEKSERTIPWADAETMVLEAYGGFAPEMAGHFRHRALFIGDGGVQSIQRLARHILVEIGILGSNQPKPHAPASELVVSIS